MSNVYAAQERYTEKQKAQGNVKISAWVPLKYRDDALDYIEQLRFKAAKEAPPEVAKPS